ncbi:response regulator [Sulfurimonas sp.]
MHLGLKNRLRLISLLPVLVLFFLTSYFAYESFENYKSSQAFQEKLTKSIQLNELVYNISIERGLTIMYLGNSSPSTLNTLKEQRKIVDAKFNTYIAGNSSNLSKHLKALAISMNKIKKTRLLVDRQKTSFHNVYKNVYGEVQHNSILELEKINKLQTDGEINALASAYISLARAKEFTSEERDLISYALSRSAEIDKKELSLWILLIAKSELISYDTLHNQSLVYKLDVIFKSEDTKQLIKSINNTRTNIITNAKSGVYEISSLNWYKMLSKKAAIISRAENKLLSAMQIRATTVSDDVLKLLIISLSIWLISVILAILGYFLSTEIEDNIKTLESVLKRVAEGATDSSNNVEINLRSSNGANEAYKLLEDTITKTREDKIAAQEASEAKSMFLANMSHEIRTPLNGIVGFTELLKDTGLGEEQNEFVEIIEKSSENLLEIINNILDLSKIESNKLEIEDIAFNPIEEFESAVEVYAVRASEKHIDLGCFVDPELRLPVKGDPTKIKEVIINLLSNAVKFTSSSGAINVSMRKIESQQYGITRVRFEVQDSGIGVTSEQKMRIFEAFGQADTSITRKYGGTGLGLTISSRFIELMGGKLDLHSEPGKGTTFFFILNFEEVEALDPTDKEDFSSISALILEDEHKFKAQTSYLYKYLNFYNVEYNTFKNMDELQQISSKKEYDVIFADYDYCSQDSLIEFSKQVPQLVLLTKSTYMKKIESLDIDIFKTLYEPLNNSKIKNLLYSYQSQDFKVKKSKKTKQKIFDAATSKFDANVLVAEDNIINQKLIKRTLEDIGLNVTIASNGLEAFQKRKDGNFDIIFMDIQMPHLDGVEATKEIIEYEEDYNQPHVPIIALTANALKGDRERFLKAGLDEYTTKPLVRSEIITLLNQFLSEFIVEVEEKSPTIEKKFPEINELEDISLETQSINTIEDIKEEPILENKDTKIEVDDTKEILENTKIDESEYMADILLAKKSSFETKLYTQLLESLNYSYNVVNNNNELDKLINSHTYKIILLDKEFENINIAELSQNIKDSNKFTGLKTNLIMIDSQAEEDADDKKHVSEVIKNTVNKDLLKTVFEKFI